MSTLVQPHDIGGNALVRDYVLGTPSALTFFPGSPFQLESFRRKLVEVRGRFGQAERERAASALRPSSDAARDRLARWVVEGGAVVTTGQQTGFLTGPLYTIYKAISAVVLAHHLEKQLRVIVLPVFWIASEDHDWAEVNHAILLDRRGRAQRFELAGGDPRPLPMSERILEGDLDVLCDSICQYVLPHHDTIADIRRILDAYRMPGRTVAAAFSEAITGLLGRFDLLFTDAADRALKEASKPILRKGLTEAARQEEALSARTAALVEAGYSSQVTILEGGTNVFLRADEGRERLYRRGEDFTVRERQGVLSREQLLSKLETEPQRFSPNVLLRPVVESAVFPTLAYVGGPGEIAYFAQVGALFELYGIVPPVPVPRFSGLVVEKRVARNLGRLGLTYANLREGRDVLRERLARREVPEGARAALAALREGTVEGYERLIGEVEGIEPMLARSLGAIRNRGLLESHRAERKIVRAIKRGDGIAFAQLDRILDSLRPGGVAQDRALNVLPFLARYGQQYLSAVEESIRAHWRLPEET